VSCSSRNQYTHLDKLQQLQYNLHVTGKNEFRSYLDRSEALMMELLLVIGLIAAFDAAALLWGADSRGLGRMDKGEHV